MKHFAEIRSIALPAIVSNITTPILSLVDVAITGHIGDAVYIGAIALGGTVFNILYWLFNFLRMGTSGLTAQAYGAADRRRTNLILWRSLAVGLALGIAIIALGAPCGHFVLEFMDADDSTQALASHYFSICIYGAPAVMATYAFTGWFIGMQNSRAPMWVAIATNVVNIAVSASLVFGFGLKIEGVATGTTVAQWFGAIMAMLIILRKYSPERMPWRDILMRSGLVSFFKINSDIFLRTACLVAVTLWFTHAGAVKGVDILAANALLLQLFMLFSFFMDGFAFAGEALAGKYYGRGDSSALKTLIKSLMKTGVICALCFAVLYIVAGEQFLGLLAEDRDVLMVARRYMPWAVAVPLCGFAAFIWDGILIGLTRTRAMLIAMAAAMIIFFGMYFMLYGTMANDALWLSFCAYLATRGTAETILYRRFSKK